MNYFKSPKEMYKNLKIHRSIIKKQLQCLDYGFPELRSQLNKYLAFVDIQIQDYDDFFKKQKLKYIRSQYTIFDLIDNNNEDK